MGPSVPGNTSGMYHSRPQPSVPRPVAQEAGVVAQSSVSTEHSVAPYVQQGLILPSSVVSRSDVSRSLRELTVIDDYFHQAAIRGSAVSEVPTISRTLDSLAQANGLNLIHADHRTAVKEFLTKLKAHAPVVHISFPSEPSAPFTAKILEWFRANIHPHALLQIGVMPELAAGCMVRTTSKRFDFSLRKRFEESRQKLLEAISALDKQPERQMVANANATVVPEERLA